MRSINLEEIYDSINSIKQNKTTIDDLNPSQPPFIYIEGEKNVNK